ncbi:hypothetical protein SORBI_3008G109000 [Sorghum bicolor]|uniref:Replication protein A C-terminal domain-containing protein n=1 Tax=Sorghum bicolor TaxID=4558 RepID=C5YP25_SORBI|nr:hypothetical protein SORBI_3008G109000 [Sorghum bicolor]
MDVDVSKARSILPEERALEGGTRRQSPFREPNRMKVTIKMIRDACGESRDQGRLVINESQVFTVELCGMLTRIEQHERWMDYEIYDGTGSIRSRIWPRGEDGYTDMSGSRVGGYYTVNGTCTVIDGDAMINTLIAREVTNYNSVTEHMLSVIHEHLELGHRLSSNRIVDRMGTKAQLDIDKEGVLMLLSSDEEREKEDGLTEDYIRAKMGLDRDNMRKVLDGLINEGLVYNTVDEYHYKMAG